MPGVDAVERTNRDEPRFFSARARASRALLEAFVPAAQSLDQAGVERALAHSDRLVASRPASVRRQLALAFFGLELLAALRHFRRLDRLTVERRRAFLERLQDGPVLKLRLAVWGLRTLLFSGYYADAERQPELGYRPHADGWKARSTGTAP